MIAMRSLSCRLQAVYVKALVSLSDDTGAIKEGLGYLLITLFVLTVGLGLVSSVNGHQDSIWNLMWEKIKAIFDKITF